MRFDVTALGELVIDLVPTTSPVGVAYLPKPGGAPGNVAAGVARLGLDAAVISKVGAEAFGDLVLSAVESCGVSVEGVRRSADHNTALAVVSLTAEGDRDFFFYRENCADSRFAAEELPLDTVRASRMLHVGSLWLATPVSAAAQRRALACAREAGALVSADPNFRPAFWQDKARMREAGTEVLRAANIVKLSEEELALLTGSSGAEAARSLWHPGMVLLAITRGAEGADLVTQEDAMSIPGFPIKPVDTVGCGDAFMASLLAGVLRCGPDKLDRESLSTIGVRACAAGALIATATGALESMPTESEIDRFLKAAI